MEQTNLFALDIKLSFYSVKIKMQLLTNVLNTSDLPETYRILSEALPTIYKHKCFNELALPFSKEVCQTEIGHLFEHVLLEYMSQIKTSLKHKGFILKGVTDWNWKIDEIGTFRITINSTLEDYSIFRQALNKTISLVEMILRSSNALPLQG